MVKKLLILSLFITISSSLVWGQVTLEVYESDGETPFDCNDDIMVGTELRIIVSSDSNDYWSGGLFITGEDRAFGTLAGRGLDPNDLNTRDYSDLHYEDAGEFAIVTAWKDSSIWGFDLYTFYPIDGNSDSNSTVAGDWFIIDYEADEVGDCNVGFYDYSISWSDPNYFLSFSHSPTRDLNFDEKVDFADYAIFALQWHANDCNDPNWCDGADLDRDGDVAYDDLGFFVDYWVGGASGVEHGGAPNQNDPNSQPMMGGEAGGMLSTQEVQLSEPTQLMSVDEMASAFEEMWLQEEEIRERYTEAEWQEFIDSVKNLYQ